MQMVSGFCHFGLVYSLFCDRALTLPSWSCFLVRILKAALSLVCVPCSMWGRGVRIPAVMSCSSFGSRSCFGHSRSMFGLAVGACGLKFAQAACSSVRVFCVLFCCTQLVLLAACYVFVLCCVARSLCFFNGCVLSCLSCFV